MLKRIVKSLLVFAACLLVFVAFVPMLLSVSKVNQFLISCVNSRIGGKLHAEEIQVGWTDGISVKGLQIDDPQGRNVADIQKVSCDVALLSLIHAPAIEGHIQVEAPTFRLIDDNNDGHFSIEKVFTQGPKEQPSPQSTELTLSDLHLSLDIQPEGQAKVNLTCQVENGEQKRGSILINATAQNFAELEKAYKSALGQAKSPTASTVALDCHIDNFPLKAAVPFIRMTDASLARLIVPALGDSLNAKISHTLRGDELGLSMLVQSPQLSLKLKSAIKDNTLTIKEAGSLNWQLSNELLKLYNIDQKTPTALVARIEPYSGTLGLDGKMPLDISWKLTSPLALSQGPCSMQGTVSTAALQENVDAHADVTLGQTHINALMNIVDPFGDLQANCKFSVDGSKSANADFEIKNSLFTATLATDTIACNVRIPYKVADDILTLQKGKATVTYDTYKAVIDSIDSTINLKKKEVDGSIAMHIDSAQFDTRYTMQSEGGLKAYLNGEMKQFPVALLADIAKRPELPDLLGSSLSGNWKIGYSDGKTKEPLALTLQGEDFSFKTNLELSDSISGSDSTSISYQLTPKRFEALQSIFKLDKQKELQLQQSLPVILTVKKVHLPLKTKSISELLDGMMLKSHVMIGQATLMQSGKKPFVIAPLTLDLVHSGKDRKITFSCESDKNVPHSAQISIEGSAHNLWNEQGLQIDNARILLDSNIQNLPLDIFYTEKLVAAFGESINANFKGDIKDMTTGSFIGSVQSPRFKSDIACKLEAGTLTLDKPITAEYTLTPEAGELLLKDINPLLATARGTDSPIKLTIDSKGFKVPVKPFSLKDTQIKHITVEPGKLTCKNSGMMSLLVDLLKASRSDEITLWFTPIYIDIDNGVVHCKRADALLADAFPIATWGRIDLLNDKLHMTLGLSGTAVSKGFGISTLDPSYMVQIPIRGTTQSPKIDTAMATTKVTALKLQQTASKTTAVLGGLLEVATAIVEKEDPVPQPTTNPLPWANMLDKPAVSPNLLKRLIR